MSRASSVSVAHETLLFERRLRASPEAVFTAYADVALRARWSAPSPSVAVVYAANDFRIDGVDAFRCGSAEDLRFAGVVRYLDILEGRRIVYSEVISASESRLSVSLVTWALCADGAGTQLHVTDHVVSFVGREMIDGSRSGMNGALDNLVALVDSTTR